MPAVTLVEFKEHLNLSADTSESDSELQRHLNAAIEAIEDRIGPILHTNVSERVTATNGAVVVTTKPLVSVTSLEMVTTGTTYSPSDLDLGEKSGVIRHLLETPFPAGRYDVGYVAGHDETNASDKRKTAVLYVAEHFWEMQRKGISDRPGLFGEDTDTAGNVSEAAANFVYRGYALPRRALELIAYDEQDDGFA